MNTLKAERSSLSMSVRKRHYPNYLKEVLRNESLKAEHQGLKLFVLWPYLFKSQRIYNFSIYLKFCFKDKTKIGLKCVYGIFYMVN